jgi:hypothetical protein
MKKPIMRKFGIISLVVAILITVYTLATSKSRFMNYEDDTNCTQCSMISNDFIKGDTSKRLYVVEDTTSGVVWIGIPGINQIGKK